VVDADVDALREAGLNDEQIFELTIATALQQGLRRLA
jgi:alkylhydroperoxidase family enzyme